MYLERLKYIKEEKELTQKDIATVLNVSRSRYSHYETENEIMPIKYLNDLCNYFDVSLDYILGLTKVLNYVNSNKMINKKIIGNRLKEFRKEKNLTQEKLASILKTAQSTIAEYERGTNILATPFLYTICRDYHISADYLLGKVDSPKYLN